jgi:hypothetical protein
LTVAVAGAVVGTVVTGDTANDPIFWINITDGTLTTGSVANVNISANTTLSDYFSNATYNIDLSNELGTSDVASTDTARPILMAVANYDTDSNGANDEIFLTFSEPITDASVSAGDILIDADATGTYEVVDAALDGAIAHGQTDAANDQYITLTSASLAGTGTAKVGVQVQAGLITDAATAPITSGAVQTIASGAGSGNSDKALPVITAAETGDQDSNGFIDNYKLTFSELIDGATLTAGAANGFAITNFGVGGTLEELDAAAVGTNIDVGTDYTTLYLTFSEDNSYATGGTAVKPNIAYTDDNINGVTDTVVELAAFLEGAGAPFNESDKALPVALLTNAATKTNPNAGADRYTKEITIKYSEDISASVSNSAEFTVLNTGDQAVTVSSSSEAGDTLTLVLAQSGNNNTDQMSVTYAGTSIVDAVALQAAGFGDTALTDAVVPFVVSKTYIDDGANGSVDRLVLVFSEVVTFNSADLTQFAATANGLTAFAGNPSAVAGTGTNTLTLTMTATTNLTGVGAGVQPTYTYTQGLDANRVKDNATVPNDLANIGASTIADGAAPVKVSMTLLDADTDGKVDKVDVTYSEDLSATTDLTPWTVSNIPSAGTFETVSEAAGVVSLNITEGAGTASTAVGTMTVALDNTAQITDGINFAADFGAVAPTDAAAPVLLLAYAGDKAVIPDVMNEAGDVYKLVFSEALVAPTLTEASHETDFVLAGGAVDGDNFPTQSAGDFRVARTTTNVTNDTLLYTFVGGDTANVNLVTSTADTIDINVGSVVANSIEDAAGNDLVDTTTHAALTLTDLDVTPPAFTKAEAVSATSIEITFAEPITIIGSPTWLTAVTATGMVATGGSVVGSVLTVTVNPLNNTAFAPADLAIGVSTVEDTAGNDNEAMAGKTIVDKQVPTLVSARFASLTTMEMTFSEAMGNAASVDETKITITNNAGAPIAVTDNTAVIDGVKVTVTTASVVTTNFKIDDAGQGLDLTAAAVQDLAAAPNSNVEDLNNGVADGIAPTFVEAFATGNTTVQVTFSEAVTVTTANGSDFTGGITATGAVINVDPTKVDLTVNALGNTAFTSADLDIAINAVRDTSAATNGLAATPNQNIGDRQLPVISTATLKDIDSDGKIDAVDLVFSEPILDASVDVTKWTFSGTAATAYITTVGGDADANDEKIEVQYGTDDLAVNTAVNGAAIVFLTGTSIRDANSALNLLAAVADVTELDGASPVLMSVASDRAIVTANIPTGTIWTMTFSENPVLGVVVDGDFVYSKAGGATGVWDRDGATVAYADLTGNDMKMTFTVGTAGGGWTSAALWNLVGGGTANIRDSIPNNAQPNAANITVSGLTDVTPPTISSATTLDNDGNGKIDRIKVIFNERMDNTRDSVTGFVVTGYTIPGATGAWSTTTVTDDTFTITLTEGGSYDTSAIPLVAYTDLNDGTELQDLSGNDATNYVATAATDGAAPAFVSAITGDTNNDGSVDRLVITFSENVDITDGNGGDGLPAITLSAGVIVIGEYAAANTNTLTLTISGIANTSTTIDPTYAVGGAGQIDEAAATNSEMANAETVTGVDGAAPVLVSAVSTNILQAGNVIGASTVTLTYSENVTSTGATFTLQTKRDGAEAIQGYTNAAFDGTTAAIANDAGGDTDLTLTITGATTGNDAVTYSMGSSQTQGYWTNGATLYFSAASGIADQAGVPNSLNIASTTGVSISAEDSTAPTAVSMLAYDDGTGDGSIGDGQIDRVVIYFNEAMEDGGNIDETDITVLTVHDGTGAQNIQDDIALAEVKTATAANDNALEIVLDGSHEVGTGVLTITYNDDSDANNTSLRDASSVHTLWAAGAKTQADITTVTDAVQPVIVSTDINDGDADGYLNELVITYSETIAPNSVWTPAEWAILDGNGITNLVTGASGADAGRVFTITFADTAGTTASPTFNTSSTSIKDLVNNSALGSGSVTPTDDVIPAIMTAVPVNQQRIDVTFSEPLKASTVAAGDFFINYTSGGQAPNSASVVGRVVTLTTAQLFTHADLTTVELVAGQAVTDPSTNSLAGLKTVTVTGKDTLTVASIAVTPASPTIVKGVGQTFVSTATYTNGTTADITATATWTSSDITVAANPVAGVVAEGLKVGSTVITATSGAITGTATLTVTSSALASIAVTPNPAVDLPIGSTRSFIATGTYSDGTTAIITTTVNWTSSDVAKATIADGTGVATGVAAGATNITAALDGKTSPAVSLTVIAKTLSSITVTPALPTIAKGVTQQFTATAHYSDATTADITATNIWTSSVPAVATIVADTGVSTAVAQGSTVITATSGAITGTATLTVSSATLTSIAIEAALPNNTAALPVGDIQMFKATGTYSDGTTANITTNVVWVSSDVTKAYFNNYWDTNGEALVALAAGATNITATLDGKTSNIIGVTVTGASTTPTVTAPAAPAITNASTYSVTGTSGANASISVYTAGGNWFYGTASAGGVWTVAVSLNSNQDNNFTVYATETGKAASATAAVPAITQDSNSPSVSISAPNGTTNDSTPLLTYTADAGTVVVKVDGNIVAKVSGDSLAVLTPGSHTIWVGVTDTAGNASSNSNNFTVDLNSPGLADAGSTPSGIYNEAITVYLSGQSGTVYYTTDGSTPDAGDTLYTSAGISIAASTVLKAIVLGSNGTLGPVATFDYVIKSGADLSGPATHAIVLKNNQWNIFSVPKVVTSFTANTDPAQTTLTGLVSKLGTLGAAHIIEGNTWGSLAGVIATVGHAHYALQIPQPLYGYVIYNNSGADITVTITYKDIATIGVGGENFSRALSAGWNSVGVADYEKALTSAEADVMNIDTSDGIASLNRVNSGGFAISNLGNILDYTANANNNSVNFAGTARLRSAGSDGSTNIINLRETRGYLIFISQGGSLSGSQYRPAP